MTIMYGLNKTQNRKNLSHQTKFLLLKSQIIFYSQKYQCTNIISFQNKNNLILFNCKNVIFGRWYCNTLPVSQHHIFLNYNLQKIKILNQNENYIWHFIKIKLFKCYYRSINIYSLSFYLLYQSFKSNKIYHFQLFIRKNNCNVIILHLLHSIKNNEIIKNKNNSKNFAFFIFIVIQKCVQKPKNLYSKINTKINVGRW